MADDTNTEEKNVKSTEMSGEKKELSEIENSNNNKITDNNKTTNNKEEVETQTEKSEDEVEIVDSPYPLKIKPVLDDETIELLEKKKEHKLPKFRRQEWFRYKRLGKKWRKPRGLHSKARINKKFRSPNVRVGYGTPAKVRSLHPSGFIEKMVYNPNDLDKIHPEKEAARIGGTVGRRKRMDIIEKADSMNIRVLNRRGL